MATQWIAHSAGVTGREQTMAEHATNVTDGNPAFHLQGAANRCPAFLRQDAIYAGLFHDFGKYSDLFRQRLDGLVSGLDHWCPGAHFLLKADLSDLAAAAVHGHHVGLGEWARVYELKRSLFSVEGRTPTLHGSDLTAALDAFAKDGLGRQGMTRGKKLRGTVGSELDARMVLSALVDADYADTAHHMRGEIRPQPCALDVDRALKTLEDYVGTLGKGASEDVRRVRNELRDAAIRAASNHKGLFVLEAPTGTGKTLAMLEFALRHLKAHPSLRRIIVVLPFLSITDQTIDEYRNALRDELSDGQLLEHTSLADWRGGVGSKDDENGGGESSVRRSAEEAFSEDWLPPIIVTTTVQLFESLFSDHPARCRKLCSVANSVVLVDEVQTLPMPLLLATTKALSRLAHPEYGCSVVLSTATQPHLSRFVPEVEAEGANAGWSPVPIIGRNAGLYDRTRRYEIDWSRCDTPVSWASLAKEIADLPRVLCIVNTRKDARRLAELVLQEDKKRRVRHLSTNMCAAHRRRVISLDEVSVRGADSVLVSTQCIESGVDLDYPVVFRALAPLDAIAQAAGRCNRGGAGLGSVNVFLPEDARYPGDLYKQGALITDTLRKELGHLDPQDPSVFDLYFQRLYSVQNTPGTTKKLEDAIKSINFPEIAKLYRLIERRDLVHILVPFAGAPEVPYRATAKFFREAQPFLVDADRKDARISPWLGKPILGTEDWYALRDASQLEPADRPYSDLFGLLLDQELPIL